jgi:hypothetical protein
MEDMPHIRQFIKLSRAARTIKAENTNLFGEDL